MLNLEMLNSAKLNSSIWTPAFIFVKTNKNEWSKEYKFVNKKNAFCGHYTSQQVIDEVSKDLYYDIYGF